ncbi:cytochrome b/b6 domain-containing protein [Tabrizicola sp. BL-A-41-H6]|uniref:cytochrome b/b6 domain-containing protein n=1 Tax=Tabrizicola sp. BL-A-41-H6 TaxID=3421107 RepID=UPI003D67C020
MAAPQTSGRQAPLSPPDLWDPVVRISHWGLAFIVVMNAIFTEGGSQWHLWLGWIGMALLVLRLVWGVLGPVEARFSAFPPNPRAALSHMRRLVSGRAPHYPSHNPAGALMVYAFWATLAVVIGTGLVMTGGQTPMQAARDDAAVASGDWSVLVAEDDDGGDGRFGKASKEVHEVAANLLLILAALHIAGVAVESRAMRRNLVAPMLAGSRRRRG